MDKWVAKIRIVNLQIQFSKCTSLISGAAILFDVLDVIQGVWPLKLEYEP